MKKITIVVLMLLGLSGCDNKITYSFLIQNPSVLKDKISKCLALREKNKQEAAECEIVMSAADTINKIIEEQQADPEKFGQRIIDAEISYAKSLQVLKNAQKSLSDLKASQASLADLQAADAVVTMAKKIADDKQEEMKVYLAVMGMNSPE